jgi:GWxTD domain-containing protein
MKKLILFLFLSLTLSQSWALRCFTDYRVFHLPASVNQGLDEPYIEFYFDLDGHSFTSIGEGNEKTIGAEFLITISKDQKIIGYKKFKASYPWTNEVQQKQQCMAIERIPVTNGNLQIDIEISDLGNVSFPAQKLHDEIQVINLDKGAFISDINWIKAYSVTSEPNGFSKSGYDLFPLLSDVRYDEEEKMDFYCEVYNTDQYFGTDPFIVQYQIVDKNLQLVQGFQRIKREIGKPVLPLLLSFDITNLAAGEYQLEIVIFDKQKNSICSQKRKFSRKNTRIESKEISEMQISASFAALYTDSLALREIIRSFLPIAKGNEKQSISTAVQVYNLKQLQGFMYQFWYKRNPLSPELAWSQYSKEVEACQVEFGTKIKKGWETDRGRVYLQYGKPSTRVIRNNDPDYWPFEIWHYYQTSNNMHNKRLLFYNTSLNGDMELLHSDIPGEITNFDWKNLVRSRQMNDPTTIARNKNNQRQDPYSGDELEGLWYNPH